MIDIQQKKNKILELLKTSGPSLPVQVARAIQMDPVFASAILSELIASKQIKTSHMKIGASPLYLTPNQEHKLEEKTEHLKSAEKEAQEKLKLKIIITDEEEEPKIRVALRNIKDFAIPFKFQDKITWKYAFSTQEEVDKILFPKKEEPKKEAPKEEEPKTKSQELAANTEVPKAWEVKKEEIKQIKEESKKTTPKTSYAKNTPKIEDIFEKEKEPSPSQQNKTTAEQNNEKAIPQQVTPSKKTQSFLEEIEQSLKTKDTVITTIEEVDKKKVIATIKSPKTTSMLFAFNKARITETELLKCYKIANKKNLPYQIITRASLTKKLLDTISAYQKLLKIGTLNNP